MQIRILLFTSFLLNLYCTLSAQSNSNKGTLILTSGGKTADSIFISLLNISDSKVIYIPTAASSLRSEGGVIWNPGEEEN